MKDHAALRPFVGRQGLIPARRLTPPDGHPKVGSLLINLASPGVPPQLAHPGGPVPRFAFVGDIIKVISADVARRVGVNPTGDTIPAPLGHGPPLRVAA